MTQHNAKLTPLAKRLMQILAVVLPLSAIATELPSSSIDVSLPVHQKPKLHTELSDPVLGDQAQIIEWAWSPQYAERFGLQPQPDGLPNGGLWLVGVKIERQQNQQWQRYTCNIVGLMDNKLPILTPPGDVYTAHPSWAGRGGLPGKAQVGSEDMRHEVQSHAAQLFGGPAQVAWSKFPKNEREKSKPESGIGHPYKLFYRHYQQNLAYVEWEGGCGYFRDPEKFRNEIRFPTQAVGKKDEAVFESTAVKFDLPDSLMRRIYPYAVDADDWTSCFMRRTGRLGVTLTLRAKKSKRFGNTCEPQSKQPK